MDTSEIVILAAEATERMAEVTDNSISIEELRVKGLV